MTILHPPPGSPTAQATLRGLRVRLADPRGFCAGVRRAINAVSDALEREHVPLYVRRPIVHNMVVVHDFEQRGVRFVQEIDEVPAGGQVVFSAHGVSPAVRADAAARKLRAIDATCPLVAKVHREVARHLTEGRQVILIGHAGHPEIEGLLGIGAPACMHVVNSPEQVDALEVPSDWPTAYAIQTTFCVTDAQRIVERLEQRFAMLAGPTGSDICYATANRQRAVRAIAAEVSAFLIAGECFSSNANRLAEVARAAGCAHVQLVAGASEIDWDALRDCASLGLTAAASTPERTVHEILDALRQRYELEIETHMEVVEDTEFKAVRIS